MAGQIILVMGGKGGVGKSVFAANLAIAINQEYKTRPLVVDLDLSALGDQNVILGGSSPKSIVDISKIQTSAMDAKTIGPFLGNHASGISYLSAPRDAILARDLDLDGLGKFFKASSQLFNFVIVDCGNVQDAHVLKSLEYANLIFVLTTADVIVINQTKRVLSKISELLFPPEMVQVIINRVQTQSIINPQVIQKNLNRNVFATLPEETQTCDSALAKGVPFTIGSPSATISRSYHDLVRKIQQTKLFEQLAQLKKPSGISAKIQAHVQDAKQPNDSQSVSKTDPISRSRAAPLDAWTAMKIRIHKALVEKMDLKKTNTDTNDPKQKAILREKTQKAIFEVLSEEDVAGLLPTRELKAQICKEVLDEALGLGPLEDLLMDDSVTEVMVNARDQIYVERSGKNQQSKVTFSSEQQMMNVVERIVTPLGRRVDEKVPYVDARLSDGSRVHIIIPPLALRGPTITIRKFPKKRFAVKDLINYGTLTPDIGDFLRVCVESRLNVVVSGGTGSGKTTLLNVLSNFIPANERIITIEDSAELQLGQEHVVRLESRPKNIEGEGEVSIRDLVKASLRMRPDRIVVGECRAGEALDMLQAMNTGHDGSITTLHANNPRECLQRLETLVLMAGLGLPSKAIKETIASAVNIIIQVSRLSDGSRKITHISEVTGMQGEVISLQDIFTYKIEGFDKKRSVVGKFIPTGFVPKFVEEMEARGLKVSRTIFGVRSA